MVVAYPLRHFCVAFFQKAEYCERPRPEGNPKELKTIEDHIRAWRLDNRLLQTDIENMLSVCEDSVAG
jgi:hypothetical protein